jgi:hypothetical protein
MIHARKGKGDLGRDSCHQSRQDGRPVSKWIGGSGEQPDGDRDPKRSDYDGTA